MFKASTIASAAFKPAKPPSSPMKKFTVQYRVINQNGLIVLLRQTQNGHLCQQQSQTDAARQGFQMSQLSSSNCSNVKNNFPTAQFQFAIIASPVIQSFRTPLFTCTSSGSTKCRFLLAQSRSFFQVGVISSTPRQMLLQICCTCR